MSLATFQSYQYLGRTITVSIERYGKGWLGDYSIDGGPPRRCDGRPLRSIGVAMEEAEQEARHNIDRMLSVPV